MQPTLRFDNSYSIPATPLKFKSSRLPSHLGWSFLAFRIDQYVLISDAMISRERARPTRHRHRSSLREKLYLDLNVFRPIRDGHGVLALRVGRGELALH